MIFIRAEGLILRRLGRISRVLNPGYDTF